MRDRWAKEYEAHQHTVVLALLANGIRLDEARELAQDAWARLYEQDANEKLETLELPGLVIRQAFFLLLENRRRSHTSSQREGRLDEAMSMADHHASPEETLSGRQVIGAVEAALEHASPRAQSVMAAVVSGPDALHAELAKSEGVSLQRFRQILCEVRAQVRAVLARGDS